MSVQQIDTGLIKRAVRGDPDAFARLFDAHYEAVHRYGMWLCGDPDVAEDITQETFIRAHRSLNSLGPPYNIRAWLFRLARNYYIDQQRRKNPEVPLNPEAPIAALTPTPESQIAFGELSSPISIALGRLPTSQREALVLREIEGMQYADIADVLGMSLDNVKVMLHRARNTFKDYYAVRILAEDPRQKCEVLGDLLDTFVDGQALTAEEDALVRQHIKQCETCQQRKREIAAIGLLLRGIRLPGPTKRLRRPRKKQLSKVLIASALAAVFIGGSVLVAGAAWYFTNSDDRDSGREVEEPGGFGGGSEPTASFVPETDPATRIAGPTPTHRLIGGTTGLSAPSGESGSSDSASDGAGDGGSSPGSSTDGGASDGAASSSAVCAANGGIEWEGLTCVCPGRANYVIVCNDGTKLDNPRSEACTPTDACTPDGGTGGGSSDGGGDVCVNTVCGDGKCDYPTCEDSMSCPNDCFG
jgi:RNA polymerase sigma-70 factor, ECF subfamily